MSISHESAYILSSRVYVNVLSIGYGILISFFLLLPLYRLDGLYTYPLFFIICTYFFVTLNPIKKKWIVFISPLILMLTVVSMSHLRGSLMGFPVVVNDFSDYLKFFMPSLLFISLMSLFWHGKGEILVMFMRIVIIFYCAIFLLYILFGAEFIYSIGLGRREMLYYRYGGIDINPNAYASISIALIVITFCCFKSNFFRIIFMSILLLSLMFSQSRTNIIAFFLSFFLFLLFLKGRIWEKCVLLLVVLGVAFFAFSYFDLYWLQTPGRLDIESDRSFNLRVERSLLPLSQYIDVVDVLGVGPGRGFIDRLDTITYIMYFIRFGILGAALFLFIHLWFSLYFLYFVMISKLRSIIHKSKYYHFILAVGVFPIYVLISNISNEKWIDLKFIILWFFMMSYSFNVIETLRKGEKFRA